VITIQYLRKKFEFHTIKPHDRIVIIGRTGSGKSVFADRLLKYLSKANFIILLDTKNEYEHLNELDFRFLESRKKGIWKITELEYKGFMIEDNQIICEFFSELLFNTNKKLKQRRKRRIPFILAIEEMGNVTKKSPSRLYDISPNFAKLLQQGRSQNIGLICTSQRTAEMHTTILSQANHIIAFEVYSKHDKEALKPYIDPDLFNDLKQYEFFHYNTRNNYLNHCYKIYLSNYELNYYNKIFGES